MIVRKIKEKLAKWVMKDIPILQSPIQPIIIENSSLKKFHAQKIIPYWQWEWQVEPDCFIKEFKYEVVNKFLNEIIIKVSECPDGIMYEADLLFENV